jgi:hypothetical protein
MAIGRYLVESHLREGRSVAELRRDPRAPSALARQPAAQAFRWTLPLTCDSDAQEPCRSTLRIIAVTSSR